MSPVTWALHAAADVVLAVAAALIVTVVTLALADAAWCAWDRHKAGRDRGGIGDDVVTIFCRHCDGQPWADCTCTADCGRRLCDWATVTGECESLAEAQAQARAQGFEDWDDEPCDHDCDEECEDYQGFSGCPGYCDDHQTYNLRPAETGGDDGA